VSPHVAGHRTGPPGRQAGTRLRPLLAALLPLAGAAGVSAQAPDYFAPQPLELGWNASLELRQEWSEAFGRRAGEDRRRARLLAGAEGSYRWLRFGLTGDFVYSSDDNVAVLGEPGYISQRDNYRSRDARVDSAFLSAAPVGWLRLDAGRFPMPVGLTGLVWDADLRPQGAALSLSAHDQGAARRLSLTAFGARGSHVFDDAETTMWAVAGEASFELGERTSLDLTAAFVTWQEAYELESALWRQNSYETGVGFLYDYEVLDVVARLHRDGGIEAELVVDVCRNLAADEGHTGVWLALVLDGAVRGWPRLEYVYVWVDRDATLGAYAADDYLWTTGWEGHELRLAYRLGDHAVVRATGLLSRFKDAPQQRFRDDWVGRARIELALRY
jgi:hypothetical protein